MSKLEYRVVQLSNNKIVGTRKTKPAILRMWSEVSTANPNQDYVVVKVIANKIDIKSLVAFVRNTPKVQPQVIKSEPVVEVEAKEKPLTNKEIDAMGLTPPFKNDAEAYTVLHDMLKLWDDRAKFNKNGDRIVHSEDEDDE